MRYMQPKLAVYIDRNASMKFPYVTTGGTSIAYNFSNNSTFVFDSIFFIKHIVLI